MKKQCRMRFELKKYSPSLYETDTYAQGQKVNNELTVSVYLCELKRVIREVNL